MNPKYVTSPKLSKRLKELGVEQSSEFYWCVYDVDKHIYLTNGPDKENRESRQKARRGYKHRVWYSAFLSVELGEMLPHSIDGFDLQLWHEKENYWDVAYNTDTGNLKPMPWTQSETEPEARGLMLAYLRENKLIALEDK